MDRPTVRLPFGALRFVKEIDDILSPIDHHLPFVVEIDAIGVLSDNHDAPWVVGLGGFQKFQNARQFIWIIFGDDDHIGLAAADRLENAQVINVCHVLEFQLLIFGQQASQPRVEDVVAIEQYDVGHH